MNNNNPVHNWSEATWTDINNAVYKEVNAIRVSTQVFTPEVLEAEDSSPDSVIDEEIDLRSFIIKEGKTKPFVEVYKEFSLTNAQANNEEKLHTCLKIAKMVAKEIALAEDKIIFQGVIVERELAGLGIKTEQIDSTGNGLLGKAEAQGQVHEVKKTGRKEVDYGENLFVNVAKGIMTLNANSQAPDFALILPSKAYTDAYVPPAPQSLVYTAERLVEIVKGGFFGTATLPSPDGNDGKGLLIALGGEPTKIYIGKKAKVEYLRPEGANHIFRVVERIQFVIRDPRAYVELVFEA